MRDLIPDQVEYQRLGCALACDRNLHVGTFGSFEHVGHIFRIHVVRGLAVHGDNHVSGPYAGLEGRCAFKRTDHDNLVALRLNQHAYAVVLAMLVFAHLGVGFWIVKAGMGVEHAQHARDSPVVDGLFRFVAGQRLGVVLFHQVVNTGEGAQIVAQRGFVGAGLRAQPLAHHRAKEATNHKEEEDGEQKPSCAGGHMCGLSSGSGGREGEAALLRGPECS